MSIEREERDLKEKNTLDLLSDVRKKWHDKEEAKIQKLRKDIEAANAVVQVLWDAIVKKVMADSLRLNRELIQ